MRMLTQLLNQYFGSWQIGVFFGCAAVFCFVFVFGMVIRDYRNSKNGLEMDKQERGI
jgi:hypothetical protein